MAFFCMNKPFIRTDKFNPSVYLDRDSFNDFCILIKQLGFNVITLKLPHEKERIRKNAYSVNEYLKHNKDYRAVILVASNKTKKENIKILFQNSKQIKSVFFDDVFPYQEKDAADNLFNLYVSTYDPVRTNGLSIIIKDFLIHRVRGTTQTYLTIGFLSILIAGFLLYARAVTPPFQLIFAFIITLTSVVCILLLPKTGLYISSLPSSRTLPEYIQELKKNWLVLLVTSLLSLAMGIFGQYLSKILGITT